MRPILQSGCPTHLNVPLVAMLDLPETIIRSSVSVKSIQLTIFEEKSLNACQKTTEDNRKSYEKSKDRLFAQMTFKSGSSK